MDGKDKKTLSEVDICDLFITPEMKNFGWDPMSQIPQEGTLALSPIVIRGHMSREAELHSFGRIVYKERLHLGGAREQTLRELILSTYSDGHWKIDQHYLLHFICLRMDAHAQLEIRSDGNVIGKEIIARWCPLNCEAFKEYRHEELSRSKAQGQFVRLVAAGRAADAVDEARKAGSLPSEFKPLNLNREWAALIGKPDPLEFSPPWNEL